MWMGICQRRKDFGYSLEFLLRFVSRQNEGANILDNLLSFYNSHELNNLVAIFKKINSFSFFHCCKKKQKKSSLGPTKSAVR